MGGGGEKASGGGFLSAGQFLGHFISCEVSCRGALHQLEVPSFLVWFVS